MCTFFRVTEKNYILKSAKVVFPFVALMNWTDFGPQSCIFLTTENNQFLRTIAIFYRTMHPSSQYFDYDEKTGKSACIVDREHCKQFITRKHKLNLLAHLKRLHDKQYKIVLEKMKPRQRKHDIGKTSEMPTSGKRFKMDDCVTRTEINNIFW